MAMFIYYLSSVVNYQQLVTVLMIHVGHMFKFFLAACCSFPTKSTDLQGRLGAAA